MIDFPLEVGILGWVSTAIMWTAVVVAVVGIVKVVIKKKSP